MSRLLSHLLRTSQLKYLHSSGVDRWAPKTRMGLTHGLQKPSSWHE